MTNITQWLELTQGGNSFLVDVPVYYNQKFQGTITAAMDFKMQFDRLSSYLENYALLLKDEQGNVFYSFNNPKPEAFSQEMIYTASLIADPDRSGAWSFQFMYNNPDIISESLRTANYAFILGLILSFCLALVLFYALTVQYTAKQFELTNKSLQVSNLKLEEQKQKADSASQAKTEFLSNMSHEIRTPLNAIVGLSNLLDTNNDPSVQSKYLNYLKESSRALLALVTDILVIDRIESGKEELSMDYFDPRAVLNNILSFYSSQIQAKGLTLESNIPKDESTLSVIGDRSKFEQIIINLLRNAIKFTPKGGIKIDYSEKVLQENASINLEIIDSGIGIPQEKIDHAFERFTQVDAGVRKQHAGSGLGLTICKQFVDLMGGTIKIKSREAIGTTVFISFDFPIRTLSNSPVSSYSIPDLSGLNVLAVDDNKLNLLLLIKILELMGMKADQASTGVIALKKCEQKAYDLIFMDVHMPDLDGFETTLRIRSMNDQAVIIGLSADATEQSLQEGLNSGMNYYLTKPLDKEKLSKILDIHFKQPVV